jgi:hypothetical protein
MRGWGELQSAAGAALVESLSDDNWRTTVLEFVAVASVSEARATATDADGHSHGLGVPTDTLIAMSDLRDAMATPEHGAWFTAVITLTRDLSDGRIDFSTTFDYDGRPHWDVEPDDANYIEDLHAYPRPDDEVPAWHPAKKPS